MMENDGFEPYGKDFISMGICTQFLIDPLENVSGNLFDQCPNSH